MVSTKYQWQTTFGCVSASPAEDTGKRPGAHRAGLHLRADAGRSTVRCSPSCWVVCRSRIPSPTSPAAITFGTHSMDPSAEAFSAGFH